MTMTPEQINEYEAYNILKFHQIVMSAMFAQENIEKSKDVEDPDERERLLNLAISDLKDIRFTYAKDDYPGFVRVKEEE